MGLGCWVAQWVSVVFLSESGWLSSWVSQWVWVCDFGSLFFFFFFFFRLLVVMRLWVWVL